MITISAKTTLNQQTEKPFILGVSQLGQSNFSGEITFYLNRRQLISAEREIVDRSDVNLPSYGIISNKGNFSFRDENSRVLRYANDNLFVEGAIVDIYLENTLFKYVEKIGHFKTTDWDYDNDNYSVSVSIKDDLEEWQDIFVEGFSYDPQNPNAVLQNRSAEDLYKWLHNKTPTKYKMLPFEKLDNSTKDILTNTIFEYPLLKDASLWEQWTKLCGLCALYIYKNNQGETVCTHTYGS